MNNNDDKDVECTIKIYKASKTIEVGFLIEVEFLFESTPNQQDLINALLSTADRLTEELQSKSKGGH